MSLLAIGIMACSVLPACAKKDGVKTISSVKELANAAASSNKNIKMEPGTYQLSDYLTEDVIANTKASDISGRKAMLLFSGNNNTFDLSGVTLEIDTKLLSKFNASINEIQITGKNNTIIGLTVTDIGNYPPTTKGARSFVITGDNNKIDGVTLNMSGSSPFGYGDLLGKGSSQVTKLQKHSGMLIEGLNDTIVNCSIYSKSFGHLFFIQGGRNIYFENCYAEAVIRSTDEMLSETSGPAFDINFKSVYPNRNKESVITAGYAKSLSECGFRNYGSGGPDKNKTGAITLVNCRAKNTRIGFAFTRMDEDMTIENCEAQGCEVGYSLAGVTVKSSRGDAKNGPLFNMGANAVSCDVELELMPAVSNHTVHSIGTIAGDNHKLKISKFNGETRSSELPIMVGSGRPTANNGYSPFGNAASANVEVANTSGMPLVLSPMSSSCRATSNGTLTNNGKSNTVSSL